MPGSAPRRTGTRADGRRGSLGGRAANARAAALEGAGWAMDQVSGASRPLLAYLLGRVRVVATLDEAEALWRRNGIVATYVTPEGEVLAPTGRLHGGAAAAGG